VRLQLGNPVRCNDDAVRELADVVIDSKSNRVTHLVVQPSKLPDEARLVPVALVDAARETDVSLRCSAEELDKLDRVHEYVFLRPGEQPTKDSKWDVGVEDVYTAPNYAPSSFGEYTGDLDRGVGMAYDRVPKGEIELRRASSVYSADEHHMGRVKGVTVDGEGRVTDLLLERGHLWWKREIAVPADAVSKLETDLVTLGVTKGELEAIAARAGGRPTQAPPA
jgi:sporulation protein YlmC with PRC-barrel domain